MKNIEAIRVILGIIEENRGKLRILEENKVILVITENIRGKQRILEFLSDLPSSAQKFSPKIPKKLPENSRSSRLCSTAPDFTFSAPDFTPVAPDFAPRKSLWHKELDRGPPRIVTFRNWYTKKRGA